MEVQGGRIAKIARFVPICKAHVKSKEVWLLNQKLCAATSVSFISSAAIARY